MAHFDNDDGLDDPVTLDRWEDNDAWDRAYCLQLDEELT